MADNTLMGTTTDTIRDVQKGGGSGPKSQVMILDIGGSGTEALLSAGQKAMASSVSFVLASDHGPLSVVPASPAAASYLPVRLTDGSAFYTASGGGGGGAVTQSGTWTVGLSAGANAIGTVGVTGSVAVTGTFWQATQPVSGTVTANAGTGTMAVSAATLPLPTGASTSAAQTTGNTSLASIDGKITAVNTGAVVLAAGSAAIGSISNTTFAATQSGTWNVGTVTTVTTVSTVSAVTTLGTITNALPAGTNLLGQTASGQQSRTVYIAGVAYTVLSAFVNATASGDTVVVTGTASKVIRVLRYKIGPVSAAVNVFFKSSTAGAIGHTEYLAANGGSGGAYCPHGHFNDTTTAENLSINLSTTANVGVTVHYILV